MSLPLLIVTLIVLLPLVLSLPYWGIVCTRVFGGLLNRPTVRAGLLLPEPPGGWPLLSVVVPAHNEQRVIESCVESLKTLDYPSLELIFVLDRCTDDTASVVRRQAGGDPRIHVIENDDCPDDWAGKCNAARLGAERASGKWLLFTDADTVFEVGLARASVALAEQRDADMLTLLSTLTSGRYHERVAQPVACFALMHLYPFKRTSEARRPRAFANGQFMLFRREWYESVGGHACVKDDLLEDLAFARAVRRSGGRPEVLLADGMLRCSMYDSLEAFTTGWRRIFIDACKRRPGRLRKYGHRLLGLVALPVLQVAAIGLGAACLASGLAWLGAIVLGVVALGLVAQLSVLVAIYRAIGAPAWTVCLFPAGCWIVGRSLLRAARDLRARTPIEWGGRRYVLEPR